MNNLDNIGVDELDYDIQNHMKFSWFDTDAYKFNKDNNNGYIYGIVSWVGQYDLDTVTDWYDDDGSNISWQWFKTEQERDKSFIDLDGRKFKRFSTTPLEEVKS